MPVYRWEEVEGRLVDQGPGGRVVKVVKTKNVMVCRITAPKGAVVADHTHTFDQITHILRGELDFRVGDTRRELVRAGDVMVFPAGVPHGGEVVEEAEYLDVFAPPNPDFEWERKL